MKVVKSQKGRTKSQTMADVLLIPEMVVDTAMLKLKLHGAKPEDYDDKVLLEAVLERAQNIKEGDNEEIIRLLHAQAISLHLMFERVLVQAATTNHLEQFRVFSNIALRAQQQSKDALMCLADKLQPKQPIIQQQNNAINQIVNNGLLTPGGGKGTINQQVEAHATLDTRGASEAVTIDTNLGAMGEVHWAKDD